MLSVVLQRLRKIERCPYNDNSPFRNWTKTNIKYNVVAPSSNHTQIVKKTFKKGIIILNSGGPKSSSPILVRNINYNNLELPIRIIESQEKQALINPIIIQNLKNHSQTKN